MEKVGCQKSEVKITKTREETYEYLTDCVEQAEYILNIASGNLRGESEWRDEPARARYHRMVVQVCRSKKDTH